MLIGRKRFGCIYIVKMDDLNKALATMSSTKIFMFSIKIKDLSTHGLMFWGKVSDKGPCSGLWTHSS